MSLIINSYSFGGYTARTTAFLAATGISDTTIANALNTMDLALIANGIDTKIKALYPFVGGTATTHKFNFMNPVDSDAAFRLTFSGGWTHSATGAKPNGTTAYADTHYNPSIDDIANSSHLSYYSRTQGGAGDTMVEIGCASAVYDFNQLNVRFTNIFYGLPNNGGGLNVNVANTDGRGLFLASRTSSTDIFLQKNSTQTTGSNVSARNNLNVYLGSRNFAGSAQLFSNRECSSASLGQGLSTTEATAFGNLIQAFQTALSRNV